MKHREGTSTDDSSSNDALLTAYIHCRSWETAWKKVWRRRRIL